MIQKGIFSIHNIKTHEDIIFPQNHADFIDEIHTISYFNSDYHYSLLHYRHRTRSSHYLKQSFQITII